MCIFQLSIYRNELSQVNALDNISPDVLLRGNVIHAKNLDCSFHWQRQEKSPVQKMVTD